MFGGTEESRSCRRFYDATGIHDVDRITGLRDDAEVMGDEDDGGSEFILTVFDKVQDLLLDDIEQRMRFCYLLRYLLVFRHSSVYVLP